MNIILGQYPPHKIKKAINTEIDFVYEVDLTMVFWPLKVGEKEKFNNPKSTRGCYWVICKEEDEKNLREILDN